MKLLNNILKSGHNFSKEEYTLKTKISFLNTAILFTSFFVLILTVLLHNKHPLVFINSIFIIVSIISIFLLRRDKKNYLFISYVYIAYAFLTILFLLIKYPDEYIRVAWFLILISFAFFSTGKKGGYFLSFIIISALLILYFSELIHIDKYSFYVILAFLTLNTIVINQYEERELITKARLHDLNDHLEEEVEKKTKKLIEQKNAYRELAFFDVLTSLPNRSFFQEQLKYILAKAERTKTKVAILFIDLDNFKEVNDLHGHQIGDGVLKEVAKRLKRVIRKSDILSRLGGDEFTVIISDIQSNGAAANVAQTLRQAITEPFLSKRHEFFLTASIGISIYPDDCKDINELIKCADTAMYSAKKDGRNLTHYYQPKMTSDLHKRTMLEVYIRRGIENNEFVVFYQPIINTQDGFSVGLEALARWKHPLKGLLGPDEFISVAESSALIIPLGELILKQVVSDLIQWRSEGLNPSFMSVNLSVKQLSDSGLLSSISQTIQAVNFRKDWLEFEITESYTFQNYAQAIEQLQKIRDLGIRLAIDDFGTGYSSLAYLKKLPVDKLKIDRSFIVDIPGSNDDESLVKTIMAMGKSLGLEVVAEGIENEAQKTYLETVGCQLMQGYYFSKPMSQEATKHYLHTLKEQEKKNGPTF